MTVPPGLSTDRVKPCVNTDMTDSRGREESIGLKYPRVVGGDPDCLWAVLILEPLNLFLAFNNQKALVYNETKLCGESFGLIGG